MTISLSDIADALRWLWLGLGVVWIAYAWQQRVEYRRALMGLVGLVMLDLSLHLVADFVERPESNLPSDFSLYSMMMLVAAIGGLSAACAYARWHKINLWTVVEAALICTIVGGIGGRAYQVWMHWDYYVENKDFITELSQGGFGLRGALILGFFALFVFALLTRKSFWKLADTASVGLALAQSIGWYGAYLTHTHYGIALDAAPPEGTFAPLAQIVRAFGYNFVQELPDAYDLLALRVPVQFVASIFFLGLFLALIVGAERASQHARAGKVFLVYWIAASAAGFAFGFWRGDESLTWNGLRVDQWMDLIFFGIGIALAALYRRRGRANGEQNREYSNASENVRFAARETTNTAFLQVEGTRH